MASLTHEEEKECAQLLKNSVLLSACTQEELNELAKSAKKRYYKNGDVLLREGDPQLRMFLISSGSVAREKLINGKTHNIETHMGGYTVGSLHIMNRDPCYATTRCQSDVTTYELDSDSINAVFRKNPDFAWNVANSLMLEIRRHTRSLRTPLFEQKQQKIPFLAVSIAASIESFYRAALNSILNQQLTGVKMGALFPNMHIQVPTRIMYINGFKGIRQYLDQTIDPNNYSYPNIVRLMAAVTPGILMTPVSSLLEASNAGHSNPEPLYKRWMRGIVPRAGREVIFGIGLNQLSDYCEERVPNVISNRKLRNAVGSLTAGVICGYLSHVVHNMSTLKLMNPTKSYSVLFNEYVQKAEKRIPGDMSPGMRRFLAYTTAVVFPVGLHIRTSQIVGSFIILNGTINALSGLEVKLNSNNK